MHNDGVFAGRKRIKFGVRKDEGVSRRPFQATETNGINNSRFVLARYLLLFSTMIKHVILQEHGIILD
jgi:hypothetical protein